MDFNRLILFGAPWYGADVVMAIMAGVCGGKKSCHAV